MFSGLYIAPSVVLLCSYYYEQQQLPDWTQQWQEDVCRDQTFLSKWQTPCRFPDADLPQPRRPKFYVFVVKYFAILFVGTCSGMWVWCGKTVTTWKAFFARLCGGNSSGALKSKPDASYV